MSTIRIGTSGWTYKDWRGRFYPEHLAQRDWLAYYARHFSTVELNVTTYRLPKEADLARWSAVPRDFLYTVKLSRLITHRRRPGEPQAFVDNYMRAVEPLRPFIANLLAQLPPWLQRDDAALADFLGRLPPQHRYVVEFRHPSWYCEEVYAQLRRTGAALCLHDLAGSVAPHVITSDLLYVRLHGPVRAYAGSYPGKRLLDWASRIRDLSAQVSETYVYFNNDERAFATRNALRLRELLGV
ncbi:MAG: DUF72 domain-containing protein [Candidatus Velthaea sp.]